MAAENNIIGEAGILVRPVEAGFQRDVQSIINKMKLDANVNINANTQKAQEQVGALTNEVGRLNQGFIDAAINVAGVTTAFFALRGAVNKTLSTFSGLFDQLAQARAGFSAILKSEAAGGQLLDDIREFARVSPFVTQELVNYSQQLLGVGLSAEKIVPLLEDVGNVIASVGGDTQTISRVLFTLTQIQSIGRLAGQDAMQLQSSLIPITKYLSEFLNKTTAEVKKLQEQGKISAETVFQAIQAQGDKVQGAMANATRNIAGARAVLSDTITILLQNQPVLNKIFEDLFRTILKVADFLGTPEFQQAFDNFFTSIGRIYEAIKPLGGALGELAGSGSIQALETLASVFEVFAAVLEVLPVGAMEIFARVLASIATVRAPLMLLTYAQSFTRITKGALETGAALSRVTKNMDQQALAARNAALANEQYAQSTAKAGAASKIGGLASSYGPLALAVGGSLVSDGQGGARDVVGTALTTGAIGASIGSAIPGIGTALGGAAGLVVGAFATMLTNSRKATQEMERHARELAAVYAEDVTKAITGAFGGAGTDSGVTAFLNNADALQSQIRTVNTAFAQTTAQIEALNKEADDLLLAPGGADSSRFKEVEAEIDALLAKEGELEGQSKQLKLNLDALFVEGPFFESLSGVRDKLALITDENQRLLQSTLDSNRVPMEFLQVLDGADIPRNTAEFQFLNEALQGIGLTFEDLAGKTVEQINQLIEALDDLPNKYKAAADAADAWNKRYLEGQAVSDTFTKPIVDQLNTQIAVEQALQTAINSAVSAGQNPNSRIAQLTAERDAVLARQQAYNSARADQVNNLIALQLGEQAYSAATNARVQSQVAASQIAQATTANEIGKLLQLAGVADTIDNRQIAIRVVTEGIEAALAKILTLQAAIDQLRGLAARSRRPLSAGGPNLEAEANDLAAQQFSAQQQLKNMLTGQGAEDLAKSIADAVALSVKTDSGGGGGGGGGISAAQQFADNLKAASKTMADALTQAANDIKSAADKWTTSIKERTQFERAVSTTTLTSNTQRQLAEINELTEGLANLRGRGVTDAVFQALGIDNVTDLRQVRNLVNSSDSDLLNLVSSVSDLGKAAVGLATTEEDRRTRENITAAILAAAQTLGIDADTTKAQSITNQITFSTDSDPVALAVQILNLLTAGKIG